MRRQNRHKEQGTALVVVTCFILIMSILGFGASALVPFEAGSVEDSVYREQALYLAEAGLEYAEGYLNGKLPEYPGAYTETRTLETGTFTVEIVPAGAAAWSHIYQVTSTGMAGPAIRMLGATMSIGTFAQYAYFTDYERPDDGGRPLWFATSDTISGPMHTNDQIHILGNPVFENHVTSAWGGPDDSDPSHLPYFMYYNGDHSNHVESPDASNPPFDYPEFMGGYELGTERVELPPNVDNLRANAQAGGIYTNFQTEVQFSRPSDTDGERMYGYVSYRRWKEDEGKWLDWVDVPISSLANPILFADGPLHLSGVLDGQFTVASSNNIHIIDDVVYRDSVNGIPNDGCDDLLGIIGNPDIVVDDNAANRDNCIIDASIMVVNGCFHVEQVSDGSPSGVLRICGGTIQKYRGPLCTGYVDEEGQMHILTGYRKHYIFDMRLYVSSPPDFPVMDSYIVHGWSELGYTS
jgi:Tfp pilus assembly protein PilX